MFTKILRMGGGGLGRVTSRDVAREAGVSQNTVSLVLRDSPRIREETKRAVREVMARLDYRPNGPAAALRSRSTPQVLFVAGRGDLHHHVTTALLAGAIEEAEARGCAVIVVAEDPARPARAADAFRAGWAAGAVVLPSGGDDRMLDSLRAAGCRPVALARPPAAWPAARRIRADDAGGARLAVGHLLQRGHRCLGIVAPSDGSSGGLDGDRVAAARAEALAAGATAAVAAAGGWSAEEGWVAARRLLVSRPRPTAIFAVSDRLAFGALAAAADLGLRVPAELALVGFDNVEWAAYCRPPLTTVEFPLREIGRRGVGLALDLAGGAAPGEAPPLPTRLVVREST